MIYFRMMRKFYDEANGDGGQGGGSGGGGSQMQSGNAEGQNNQQQQNNDGNNGSGYANIWETPNDDSNANGSQNQNANQNANQGGGQQQSAEEQFQAHVKSLNLMQGVNMQEAMQDPEKFQGAIETMLGRVYQSAMINANQLYDQRSETLKSEMSQNANETINQRQLVSRMNEALPFTANAAYKPVADAVLQQFLAHGKAPEEAIKEVGGYFKTMYADMAKVVGNTNHNSRTHSGFNGQVPPGQNNQQGNSSEPNWVDLLSGKEG